VAPKREIKLYVANNSLASPKTRIRQLTGCTVGHSMVDVAESLRPFVLGWKTYFVVREILPSH